MNSRTELDLVCGHGDVGPCPECDSTRISTHMEDERFTFGKDAEGVELCAEIPVHICAECGFEFVTSEAGRLKHEAVCRYLGVMTPQEISAIREEYGMSRAEFARITRLGEATLSRWERGILIQNAAYDRYLLLAQTEQGTGEEY